MTFDALSLTALVTAVGIALIHTAAGPDHYVPFVMLARARAWSRKKTLLITTACGIGHVSSSILLGSIGIALGAAVGAIKAWETARGNLAAWGLVAFGLAYALWGVRRAVRSKRGYELHEHGHGEVHVHAGGDHHHHHHHHHRPVDTGPDGSGTTFWVLFTIFVFGPCEPLIPLFVAPVSEHRWDVAIGTAVVFSIVTIATMLAIVSCALAGLQLVRWKSLERWMHSLSGAVIAASGAAILMLGL